MLRMPEWLARHATFPLHERLRGRRTLNEMRTLRRIAALPAEVVQRYCAERLRHLLLFAAGKLPYYAELFAQRGVNPRADDPYGELAKLPVLDKDDVRANADRMVCRNVPGGIQRHSSGGTTGDTLHFYIDRVRQAQPMAARLFMQRLFGVQPGDRRVYLWGSPIESKESRIKRLRDRLINELTLDAFEMSPQQTDAYLATIRAYQPRVIYGYPTAVAVLARRAAADVRHGGRTLRRDFAWLRLIVLTGEEVTAAQVAQARESFGCPVVSEYGSREVGLIAHECPRGQMHVVAPHVFVELLANGQPVAAGQCGEIICTTLNARAQPLIRYRIGDVGTLSPERCDCGLPLPLLRVAGGKITGFIALPGGRLCHGAVTSHVLRDLAGIVEFKTYQRGLDSFEVLLVVDGDFRPDSVVRVQRRYRELFGPRVRVSCHIVDRIPPDPSGKRRYVVSDVAPDCGSFEVVHTPGEGKSTGGQATSGTRSIGGQATSGTRLPLSECSGRPPCRPS